jgi:hypothetical protein
MKLNTEMFVDGRLIIYDDNSELEYLEYDEHLRTDDEICVCFKYSKKGWVYPTITHDLEVIKDRTFEEQARFFGLTNVEYENKLKEAIKLNRLLLLF